MDITKPPSEPKPGPSALAPLELSGPSAGQDPGQYGRRRRIFFGAYVAVVLLAFGVPLASVFLHALRTSLESYILLVPLISAYLLANQRSRLPVCYESSPGFAAVPFLMGLATAGAAMFGGPSADIFRAVITLAVVLLILAGGFFFFGKTWMRAAAFPAAFLFFLVPLPDVVVDWMETSSQLASAEAADWLFPLSGTPVLRDGFVFQLPGMLIRVAQECSGIHSSLVLFITSLLAANLFLKSPWRRAVLVAIVIPIGVLRNGFRILVIGLLCVHVGPHMIHSAIHRKGGPLFFAISLVPLFLVLWWLRRGDPGGASRHAAEQQAMAAGQNG